MTKTIENRAPIDWMNLPEQFIVCRDGRHVPPGWSTQAIRGWHLGHHPSLPVTVLSAGGAPAGWMLGYAISEAGVLLGSETVALPAAMGDDPAPEPFERWVFSHGGRFAAVLLSEGASQVYIDPIGSLSLVYCPSLEAVASTVTVIPREGDTGELTDLVRVVGIPESSMFPLQYTPRKNVWRLVPNHVLDLRQWSATRHWPKTEIPQVDDVTGAVDEVVDRVRLHLKALLAKRPMLLRLTAGLDSRMLLACARPWIDRIKTFTAEHEWSDEHSWLDCSTATLLARDLGFPYMRLPHCRPRQEHLDEWLMRTGWNCGEERGWRAATTFKQLPPGHSDLIALVGEVARGFYWQSDDTERTVIDVDRLARPFRAGQHPLGRAAIASWLDAVPSPDPFLTLDLFFMEQRLGCWAGLFPYAYGDQGRFQIFPILHRRIIEAMLALPPLKIRGTELLAHRVMEREWPELLRHPFNEPSRSQRLGLKWLRAKALAHRLVRAGRHPVRSARRVIARM